MIALNRLDRLVAYFAPDAAARRAAARHRLAAYAAADDSRLRKIRRASQAPNSPIRAKAARLREQARAFEQDSDIAKRGLDLIVQNVIGTGVIPEPTVRLADGTIARDFNRELARLHREWRRRPEATHRFGHAAAQALACRTWVRDGEYLAQHIRGRQAAFTHASAVAYSYEMIDPDRLATDQDSAMNQGAGRVVQGVALNAWGEPQAYFLLPYHPGELTSAIGRGNNEPIRKAATDVLHIASLARIGQVRGVSMFAQVMSRLEDVNEVDEAERLAIRIASSIALAIYDPRAPAPPTGSMETDGRDSDRAVDWHPGMILQYGDPEAKAEVLESKRPNESMPAWRKSQLQAYAGGLGVGYSSVAMDYLGSYSAQRQELVETGASYGVLWSHWVDQVEEPMYREFVPLAMLASPELRKLAAGVDERTLYDAEWSRPVTPWVDPVKEAAALEKLHALGIITKARMIRERGGIPDEVAEQVAEEKRADAELAAELMPEPAPGDDPAADPDEDEERRPAA